MFCIWPCKDFKLGAADIFKSKIKKKEDSWSLSGFRGYDPSEQKSLQPPGPGPAEEKAVCLALRKERSGGQTVTGEWVSDYGRSAPSLIDS